MNGRLAGLVSMLDGLNAAAAWLARWAVLLMLAIGFWNVVGRYVGSAIGINLSSNGLIEAQWYLFALIFLLGLGWTLQQGGHVRVDVLQNRWSPRRRDRQELRSLLLLLLPFAFRRVFPTLLISSVFKHSSPSWVVNSRHTSF